MTRKILSVNAPTVVEPGTEFDVIAHVGDTSDFRIPGTDQFCFTPNGLGGARTELHLLYLGDTKDAYTQMCVAGTSDTGDNWTPEKTLTMQAPVNTDQFDVTVAVYKAGAGEPDDTETVTIEVDADAPGPGDCSSNEVWDAEKRRCVPADSGGGGGGGGFGIPLIDGLFSNDPRKQVVSIIFLGLIAVIVSNVSDIFG